MSSFSITAEQAFFFIYTAYHCLIEMLFLFFFSRTLSPRPLIKHPFLWSLPFCLIPLIYKLLTGVTNGPDNFIFLFGSIFLACLFLYGDPFFRCLSSFLLNIIMGLTTENLVSVLLYLRLFPSYANRDFQPFIMFPKNDPIGLVSALLPIMIMQAGVTLLSIFLWNKYIRHINLKIFTGLSLFYILIFTGILYIFPMLLGKIGWFFLFIFLFLSCLLFLYNLRKLRLLLIHLHFQKKEQALAEQTLQNFKKLQEENMKLRKQNHDISNHLQAISYLLNQGKMEDAHVYIDTLMKKRTKIPPC